MGSQGGVASTSFFFLVFFPLSSFVLLPLVFIFSVFFRLSMSFSQNKKNGETLLGRQRRGDPFCETPSLVLISFVEEYAQLPCECSRQAAKCLPEAAGNHLRRADPRTL